MIELVSVQLENFRSFTEATFIPAAPGDGLTAITGRNGAGKSTIIHAIMWALYGVTPNDVPVRGLRRQGSTGPVIAKVTFRHGGQTVEVTRSLRGKNDTSTVNIEVDKVQQTVASVRAANEWLTARLRLDAQSFLTAFVVRQKELDALITDRPADRRKLIERLAGIERMHTALTAARANANELNRAAVALPDPESDPATLLTQADQAHRAHADAVAAAQHTATIAERVKAEAAEAEEITRLRRTQAEQRRTLTSQLALVEEQIRSAMVEIERLNAAARDADSLPHLQALAENTATDLAAATEAIHAANLARRQASFDAKQAQRAEQAAAAAAAEAEAAQREADAATAAAGNYPPIATIEEETLHLSEENETLAGRAGEARSERKRVSTALPALLNNTHPTCPTCSNYLPDPEAVIEALRQADAAAAAVLDEVGAQQHTIGVRLAELAELASGLAEANLAADRATERAASLARAAAKAQTEAAAAADVAAASGAAADVADEHAASVASDMEALGSAAQEASRALMAAEAAVATAAALPAKEAELHNLRGTAETLQADIAALPDTEDALIEAERAMAEKWQQRDQAIQAQHDAESAASDAGHAAATATAAAAAAAAVAERKSAALAEAEKAIAAASALDEFRKDRIARLAPELSEVASDFVARMTEGRYVTVELDENFTPTLTDSDGNQRAASWLSGGEESAVALALRVAIGEVLSGNRGGMLVLDEVLTAQDAPRRSATMSAIGELPRQVVAINHVAEATDMADHVIEVVESETGSEIVVREKNQMPVAGDLGDLVDDLVFVE